MPNVSASLSDEAYAIWQSWEGKKSPRISSLIVKGDIILLESEAKSLRIAHLQHLLSQVCLDLDIARGGVGDSLLDKEKEIIIQRVSVPARRHDPSVWVQRLQGVRSRELITPRASCY